MKSKLYTDEQIIQAVKDNFTVRKALEQLGVVPAGGSYKVFYRNVKRLNLDTSHFLGKAHLTGKSNKFAPKIELKEILIKDSSYSSSHRLKERLIKEEIITNKCSRCSISEWQGEILSLHLDHIDGNNTNNEISNLRLLCPNCHSLTPTYCGKNKK